MPAAAPALTHAFTREKLLQIARSMPADLQVLSKLGEILQDVNSELDAIASLLRRDVALAARIVRISNSPMFGGGGQIASIEEAVNRVGFAEILKLVGTASAARFSERALEHYDISAQRLRDNMLYSAFACEALARSAGLDSRVAYTAGLLRPLGMMVIDRAARGCIPMHQRFATSRTPSYSAWEGGLFGVNNCEVAALILDEWRFPPELSQAIRGHYLARADDFERPFAVLLNVANSLAHRVNRSFAGETCWWEVTPQKLRAASLAQDDFEPAIASTEAAFEAAIAALSM